MKDEKYRICFILFSNFGSINIFTQYNTHFECFSIFQYGSSEK